MSEYRSGGKIVSGEFVVLCFRFIKNSLTNFYILWRQLMDKKSLGYLDFKQLVLALGIVCSNRVTEKLKLLYILHLPPLLSKTDIESSKANKAKEKGDAEVATEAEDFFCDDVSFSIEALPSPNDETFVDKSNINIVARSSMNMTPNLSVDSNARSSIFYVDLPMDRMSQEGESIDTISDISDLGKAVNFDILDASSQFSDGMNTNLVAGTMISNDSSIDTRSLSSLRVFLDHPDSNFTQNSIPDMTQRNFMALWTSMMEIVGNCDIDMQRACKYFMASHTIHLFEELWIRQSSDFVLLFFRWHSNTIRFQ